MAHSSLALFRLKKTEWEGLVSGLAYTRNAISFCRLANYSLLPSECVPFCMKVGACDNQCCLERGLERVSLLTHGVAERGYPLATMPCHSHQWVELHVRVRVCIISSLCLLRSSLVSRPLSFLASFWTKKWCLHWSQRHG